MLPPTLESHVPATEHACSDRLAEMRWGPSGPTCDCGGHRHRRLAERPRVFVCRSCEAHTSVTAGTLLHGCHVSLRKWFLASLLIARHRGCSARELQRRIKVSYETAWQLLHRLRNSVEDGARGVAGRLMLASINIATCRPYRGGGPKVQRKRSCVGALKGDNGVRFAPLPSRFDDQDWALKATGEELIGDTRGPAFTPLAALRGQVAYTHCGVSDRWLDHYMWESQHRENSGPRGFLEACMRAARLRFADLRPAFHELEGFEG